MIHAGILCTEKTYIKQYRHWPRGVTAWLARWTPYISKARVAYCKKSTWVLAFSLSLKRASLQNVALAGQKELWLILNPKWIKLSESISWRIQQPWSLVRWLLCISQYRFKCAYFTNLRVNIWYPEQPIRCVAVPTTWFCVPTSTSFLPEKKIFRKNLLNKEETNAELERILINFLSSAQEGCSTWNTFQLIAFIFYELYDYSFLFAFIPSFFKKGYHHLS